MTAPTRTNRGLDREVGVLACAVTAGVHAGLVPEHAHESAALAASFAAAAVLAAVIAVALRRAAGSAWPPLAAGALFAGLIVAYALSRTVGLPLGEGEREPLDALGLATKAIEVAGLIAAVRMTTQPTRRGSLALAGRRLKEVRPR